MVQCNPIMSGLLQPTVTDTGDFRQSSKRLEMGQRQETKTHSVLQMMQVKEASASVQRVRRAFVRKHVPARETEDPGDWFCSSHEVPAMTSAVPSHWKSVISRVRCRPPYALLISRCCINCMGLLGTSIIYVNYTDGLLYLATMYAWFFSVTCNMVEFFSYINSSVFDTPSFLNNSSFLNYKSSSSSPLVHD